MFGAWKTVKLVTVSEHKYPCLKPCLWWMYNTSSKQFVESGPMPLLIEVKWGQKVSLGAKPTFFGINLRIMWTELKMDRSLSTKCSLFLGV